MELSAAIKARARELGFVAVGIALAEPDAAARFVFHERIDLGMYDGLPWFNHARADRATEPGRALHDAASVITLAAPYKTEYAPDEPIVGLRGRVARYAWGRDYHRVLEKKLRSLAAFIEERCGGRSRGLVDYGPLAERAYAARAGIGWFGKNTNLLLPGLGSWVLLAELVTTAPLEPDAPLAKSCGGCTRCIAACPTGAISGPYVVDNRRCISFQTIENRGWIPHELRPLLGDWVFGCDLCQDVCPVGGGHEGASLPEFSPATLDAALPELTGLLALTEERFRARFQGRAIMRAKRAGLARNVCVALGNLGDARAEPALSAALAHDPAPIVRGHAAWALGRIGGAEGRAALAQAQERERDAAVLEEIAAALAGASGAADGDGVLSTPAAWLAGPWRR
ncbi:MAG TPA: tRNA epoxyqueuosine(34) reductase QueG [Dehalococcoidia bacterium]|nr:tRNA epoxyqueuosine(34) reductase QueG [Dehalococcoidia bacterium]